MQNYCLKHPQRATVNCCNVNNVTVQKFTNLDNNVMLATTLNKHSSVGGKINVEIISMAHTNCLCKVKMNLGPRTPWLPLSLHEDF